MLNFAILNITLRKCELFYLLDFPLRQNGIETFRFPLLHGSIVVITVGNLICLLKFGCVEFSSSKPKNQIEFSQTKSKKHTANTS